MAPELLHTPAGRGATGEPPALIVPGAFSDVDSFTGAAEFLAARGRDVYALSPPARGRRIPQLDTGGLAALDRSLDRACDRIGSPLTVIGHSLGGLAVLRLLQRRRQVAAALLMPVSPSGLAPEAVRLAREQPIDAAKMIGISLSAWPVRKLGLEPPVGMFRRDAPPDAVARSAARRVSESWRALAEALIGSREEIVPVETPLLLIGGSQDAIVSAASVADLAGRLDADYREFDVAHAFVEEPGFDRVLEEVDGWLRQR
jgi:pimeloyl-ACP methyl ester carboxylesterase